MVLKKSANNDKHRLVQVTVEDLVPIPNARLKIYDKRII